MRYIKGFSLNQNVSHKDNRSNNYRELWQYVTNYKLEHVLIFIDRRANHDCAQVITLKGQFHGSK